MSKNKITPELASDVLKALGGAELAATALERGELSEPESLNLLEVLECHEVDLGELRDLFIIIGDAIAETKTEKFKATRKEQRATRKAEKVAEIKKLEAMKNSINKKARLKLLDILNKDAGTPPPQGLFVIGIIIGAFIAGYVLNWTVISPDSAASVYIMTQNQVVAYVVCSLLGGLIFATALKYPMLLLSRKKIERMGGHPVVIEYQFRSGQKEFSVIDYAQQIDINEGRHVLTNPTFTFMGLPGYRVLEGVLTSLDFDYRDIERQIDDLAADMEAETIYTGDDGKQYTLIPRGDVIAAMSPANLKHMYAYGIDLGIDKGSTDTEKNIKLIVMLAGAGMIAGIIAAYYAYDASAGILNLGEQLNAAVAYITAAGGANQ